MCVWLGQRSRGRSNRGKNRRSRRSGRSRKRRERLEFEELCLPSLNQVTEIGIVCIEILACLLSCTEIVTKNIFIKLNGVLETVYLCCCDVSGGCGGVEMVGVNKFAFLDEFGHCVKW